MSDSVRPHRWQPNRLPRPWDSPGKNTGVGCHFLLQCMKVKTESEVAQSCPTLSDPMDCSPPGSSIHGIFQARVLEWGAIALALHTDFGLLQKIWYIVLLSFLWEPLTMILHLNCCHHLSNSTPPPPTKSLDNPPYTEIYVYIYIYTHIHTHTIFQ